VTATSGHVPLRTGCTVHLHKYYLEKNQVPRELAIISFSLACLRLNETHILEAETKSYNVYPSWDGLSPSVVCFF